MQYRMEDPFVVSDGWEEKNQKRVKQYKIIIAVTFAAFLATLILFICAILLRFGCSKIGTKTKVQVPGGLKFFHVSDIHLDLYYNSSTDHKTLCRSVPNTKNATPVSAGFKAEYGRVMCDSPLKLVNSALAYMKNLTMDKLNDADFIVFTGDEVAHALDKIADNNIRIERALQTMKVASNSISNTFPNIPFLASFGNNDLLGNYLLPVDKGYYESVLKIWQPLILCEKCKLKVSTEEELRKTFLVGGFYKAEIKGSNLVFLMMNTNYWNTRTLSKQGTPEIYAVSDEQLKWVEDNLKTCKETGKKVITAGHILPGIDAYSGTESWQKNYTSKYIELVTKTYKDVVIGQLFGHIHKDDMRVQSFTDNLQAKDSDLSFLLTAPGITPIYNNNPGFRIVTIDTDRKVIADYHQHYMDLVLTTQTNTPTWNFDYSFGQKYLSNIPLEKREITGKTMAMVAAMMINSTNQNRAWKTYIQHRQVNYQPDKYSRYALYCSIIHVTKAGYDACLKKYPVTGG